MRQSDVALDSRSARDHRRIEVTQLNLAYGRNGGMKIKQFSVRLVQSHSEMRGHMARLFSGTYAECREFQTIRAAEMRAARIGPVRLRIYAGQ